MFDFLAVRLEILTPQPGIIPPSLEGKVLTAGLPGKSLWLHLMLSFQWRWSGCSLLSQSRRLPSPGLHHRVAFSSLWTCLQSFSWTPTGVHSGDPASRCKLLSCLPLLGICTLIKALTWPFLFTTILVKFSHQFLQSFLFFPCSAQLSQCLCLYHSWKFQVHSEFHWGFPCKSSRNQENFMILLIIQPFFVVRIPALWIPSRSQKSFMLYSSVRKF